MKSIQVVSSLESSAAGPSYSVTRMAQSLAQLGNETTLMSLGRPGRSQADGLCAMSFERDYATVPGLKRLGFSRALREALAVAAPAADVLHGHGLWMMPNVYPGLVARRHAKPFVLAPRGMLGPAALKFSASTKRVFWALRQKSAVDAVSCFHATADSEYEDIRAFGLRQPVAVIPNGIDLPDLAGLRDPPASGEAGGAARPYILALGRVHPKKGLDRLVAAFALVAHEHADWRLRIVGPEEAGHAEELSRQIAAAGLDGRVSIEPPVFGSDKLRLMREAEVFALSTLHENFGLTVAESLAVETPVISTRGAPWAGLETHRCGWWIEHGPEAMATALREAMGMSGTARRAMGERGRLWMQRDFGWDGIAAKMVAVYLWLCRKGDQPGFVWTDRAVAATKSSR